MATWQESALQLDKFTKEVIRRMNDFAKEQSDKVINHDAYFPTERENEARGKVVKVADVMAAIHFMAATVIVRVLPDFWHKAISEWTVGVGNRWLVKKALESIGDALPLPSKMISIIRELVTTEEAAIVEKRMEAAMREAMKKARYEFAEVALSQASNRGKVEDIRTRHRTRQKRRQKRFSSQ